MATIKFDKTLSWEYSTCYLKTKEIIIGCKEGINPTVLAHEIAHALISRLPTKDEWRNYDKLSKWEMTIEVEADKFVLATMPREFLDTRPLLLGLKWNCQKRGIHLPFMDNIK